MRGLRWVGWLDLGSMECQQPSILPGVEIISHIDLSNQSGEVESKGGEEMTSWMQKGQVHRTSRVESSRRVSITTLLDPEDPLEESLGRLSSPLRFARLAAVAGDDDTKIRVFGFAVFSLRKAVVVLSDGR
jgi:hypothetical protein